MTNTFKTLFSASVAVLCMTAASGNAEEIIWKQPSAMHGYHQNLHFEGNARLHRYDVRKLQKSLAERGFYRGRIDGVWGGRTTQAILDYQSVHGEPQTGTVTTETLRDLDVYVNENRYRDNRDHRYGERDRDDRNYSDEGNYRDEDRYR